MSSHASSRGSRRHPRRLPPAALAVFAVLVPAGAARAQGQDAAVTFDYGRAEMLAGRYATGCPALEASFRLDPRPGTLFTLADCNGAWGKTASALARFSEFLSLYERMTPEQQARQKERAGIATSERASLERAVPLLTVRLPAEVPAGTRVWRDDVELRGDTLGAGMPVDPGEHRVRLTLPDGRTTDQRITLANGEQKTVVAELPAGTAASPTPTPVPPRAPAPASAPTLSPAPALALAPAPAPRPAPSPLASPWTFAAAGLTLASFGVAAVTGGLALSERSTANAACSASGVCATAHGASAGNDAHTLADVETGALLVGGVALVATVVLLIAGHR